MEQRGSLNIINVMKLQNRYNSIFFSFVSSVSNFLLGLFTVYTLNFLIWHSVKPSHVQDGLVFHNQRLSRLSGNFTIHSSNIPAQTALQCGVTNVQSVQSRDKGWPTDQFCCLP